MRTNLPVTQNEYVLRDDQLIVSKTDLKGRITYINRDFLEVSGFTEKELIGEPHNLVRHPDMPPEAFEDLWRTLKAGRPWTGMVKNRCKNGDYYWVVANATPVWESGQITGYMSVRRKPTPEAIATHEDVYRQFREKRQGKLQIRYGKAVSGGESMFTNMSVGARLVYLLIFLGALVTALSGYTLLGLSQTNDSTEELFDHRFEPVRMVGRIGKLMADNRAQVLLGLQHDPSGPYAKLHDHPLDIHTQAIDKNIAEITELWSQYLPLISMGEHAIDTSDHQKLADDYAALRKVFVQEGLLPAKKALAEGDFNAATMILLQKINPSYNTAGGKVMSCSSITR